MNVDVLYLGPDVTVAIGHVELKICPKFIVTKRLANINLNNLLDLRLVRIDRIGDWGVWVSVFHKKRFTRLYRRSLFCELSELLDEICCRRVEGTIGLVKHGNEIRLNFPSTIIIDPEESLEGVVEKARDEMAAWAAKYINHLKILGKRDNP